MSSDIGGSRDLEEHGSLEEPGEINRLTIMFCDLAESTQMSTRQGPESFRDLLRLFHAECRAVIEQAFEGAIVKVLGDGIIATFGGPRAQEDDSERAVLAGLEVSRRIDALAGRPESTLGERLAVRVAVHRGLVYRDRNDGDIYGLAVNVASRLQSVAPLGAVVISSDVASLVSERFELDALAPQTVKGLEEPLTCFRVLRARHRGLRIAPSRGPMVGRQGEIGLLHSAWRTTTTGAENKPLGLVVRGEAGVGKSRLAAVVGEWARSEDRLVLELAGSRVHAEVGLHPIRALIESMADMRSDAGGPERLELLVGQLGRLGFDVDTSVPLLAPVLGIGPDAGYVAADTDSPKLFEAISDAAYEFVMACLSPQPSLLVADDLHWYDDLTLVLLTRVLREGPSGILVVATSRLEGRILPGAAIVDLDPLSYEESLELIDLLAHGRLDHRRRQELAVRSDGIPLYLEHLVIDATISDEAEPSEPGRLTGNEVVPDVLYDLLLARLYGTPDGVVVASTASAIGREFDRRLLGAMLDLDDSALYRALLGLVATRVLEQDSATPDLFRFRHELLRDVAYELLPPSRRKSAHSRLADNLLRQGPDAPVLDWQVLAAHFERADRAVEAAEAWEQAAEEARRRGALGEARALLGRAIALVAPSDDDTARRREVQLHLRRGFLATSEEGNSSPEAARDFERCLSLIGAETDSEELFRTLVVLWGHYAARAELARARQILDLIRRQLRDEREFFIPFNTAGYGMLDWFAGDFVGALGLLEEAADTSSRTFAHEAELVTGWYMPADPRAAIHTHLALARFVAGDLRGALGELDQASIRVAERDFPAGAFSAAYASSYEAWLHMESGNYDEAASVLDRMLRHSMHHGFASWTIVAASEQATLAAIRAIADPSAPPADLRGHAATMEGIVSTWRSAETNIFLPFYITIGGAAAARAGDLDKAAELFDHSLTFARHRDMGFYDAETLRRSAHLASDPQAVESRLLEALDLAQRQGARIFQLRICRDLYALGGEPSRALLVEAVRGFPPTTSYPELDDARRHLGDGR